MNGGIRKYITSFLARRLDFISFHILKLHETKSMNVLSYRGFNELKGSKVQFITNAVISLHQEATFESIHK